jgi:hypothetical protein
MRTRTPIAAGRKEAILAVYYDLYLFEIAPISSLYRRKMADLLADPVLAHQEAAIIALMI